MKVLILGGIREAVSTARELHLAQVPVTYSIAGLVRQPDLDCPIVSGGYSQIGGFESYLRRESITLVLDMTHPYASRMSQQAAEACNALGIPCWRYLRPAWEKQADDNWHEFESWSDLVHALVDHQAILFTAGRLEQTFVESLYEWTRDLAQKQWVRSTTRPVFDLPPSMSWIDAIGPYYVDGERELMNKLKIDAVISKNSGGEHANAKLEVARERGIPVYMLRRPELVSSTREFDNVEDCRQAVLEAHQRGDFNDG